jgi:hypothetical protein
MCLMMNNKVGLITDHITTIKNIIADRISRIKCKTHSVCAFKKIIQDYPALVGCKRFQPSATLILHIMDAILQKKFINPIAVNNSILKNPGQIIS